jgi:signal transduction histidine kinase
MDEALSGPISEPAIAGAYDRQRRLGLARIIAPTFGALLTLFTLVFTIYLTRGGIPSSRLGQAVGTDGVLVACIGLFAVGAVAARRGHLWLATGSTIVATNVVIIAFDVLWSFLLGNGLDPVTLVVFAAIVLPIMLAGTLGEPWMIVVTTLFMNVITLILLGAAPSVRPPNDIEMSIQLLVNREKPLFGSIALLVQWAFGVLALTTVDSHRRTLHDIGSAYSQVKQLDQLDQLKDQFITNVNHELRNPTMALQGYVELLRLRHVAITPERRAELIEKAARAGDDLVALLTSVLDLQRLDSGAQDFTPESVNLRAALEDAARLVDPREGNLSERELRVQVPEALEVWGERVRLRQILTNLLSNAVKYSAGGTSVEVAAHIVTLAPDAGGPLFRRPGGHQQRRMVEFSVRDHGLGIPPEQIPLLFKRFVRLPRDLASNIMGNGLGLHLCRVLAEAMGGSIWVESTGIEGEGATFYVRLPVPPPPEASAPTAQAGVVDN